MTIGILFDAFCQGGTERVVARLLPLFLSADYKIVVLSTRGTEFDVLPDIPSHARVVVGSDGNRISRIVNAIREYDVDVCIFEDYWHPNLINDCHTVRSMQIPYIIHYHNVFSDSFYQVLQRRDDEKYFECYQKAAALITLSRYDEYFFRTIGCNAHCFSNPIEDVPLSFKRKEAKHEILWLARFHRQKQPMHAIEIFLRVLDKTPDAKLVMVGGLDTDEGREVLTFVKSNPRLRQSVLLPGFSANVWEWYSRASVFLSTSAFEGFALTFMEAAAAGVPIVGYDLPYCETIKGNDGFVAVKQGDIEAAADAICRLLENDEERAKAAAANRATFERMKSFDQMAAYGKLFEGVKNGVRAGFLQGDECAQVCLKTLAEHAMFGIARLKNDLNSCYSTIKRLKRSSRRKKCCIIVLSAIIITLLVLLNTQIFKV